MHLEILVPLVPVPSPCRPALFVLKFYQTLHDGHTERVYIDLWRLLTVLQDHLRRRIPLCSNAGPGRIVRLCDTKICQEELVALVALVEDVRTLYISMDYWRMVRMDEI